MRSPTCTGPVSASRGPVRAYVGPTACRSSRPGMVFWTPDSPSIRSACARSEVLPTRLSFTPSPFLGASRDCGRRESDSQNEPPGHLGAVGSLAEQPAHESFAIPFDRVVAPFHRERELDVLHDLC